MLFLDFLQYLKEFSIIENVGLDDTVDRLNYKISVVLLLLCSSFVTIHQYVLSPISCFINHQIGGINADNYLQNMCWTEGLFPVNFSQTVPQLDKAWNDLSNQVLSYYQWVPMVLGLQAIVYTIPWIFWQLLNSSISGVNFCDIMKVSRSAHLLINHTRIKYVELIGTQLSILMNTKKKMKRKYLFYTYLLTKLIYIGVNYLQLTLIYYFLAFNKKETYLSFGKNLALNLINGRTLPDIEMFPKIGMCRHKYENLGSVNYMFAQCALPINMINENIYVFLYFYIIFLLSLSIYSFFYWLINLGISNSFKYKLANKIVSNTESKAKYFDKFYKEQLQTDGCFVLKMLISNSGSMISEEIISFMFNEFVIKNENENFTEIHDN